MEIRNPDYLVEIARQRGISRAAEQLFVTQSTLSQYLLKLEAEVGTPLFLRDQGKLTLTDAGRICVAAAEDSLRIERTAEASVAALQSRGQIDLGVTSAWGMALVADLLPEFLLLRHPFSQYCSLLLFCLLFHHLRLPHRQIQTFHAPVFRSLPSSPDCSSGKSWHSHGPVRS